MSQFVIAFLGLFFITTLTYSQESADEKRLDEVAERGAHVMPFDLERTLHIFSKTNHGGIQQVIVKNKSDTEQINLIRSHLSKIAAEFKRSNFSNPEKIHGKNMPGLADLKTAKDGQIKICL